MEPDFGSTPRTDDLTSVGEMRADGDLTVSVVVPVWNPGGFLERCVRSLLAQTLSADDMEIILVDDGSTDGTAERLDELAAAHRRVRVQHESPSGWAGRPRNVGIALARGRWIQFVDQDDALTRDALRRLTALGDDAAADIVLGKVTSDWRPVDHDVYRHDRTDAQLSNAPLIKSLTPHKMFRRSFLMEHDLRFPEGKRRLEDQLFMVETYVRASNVAILGSYECYRYLRRDDGGNAGSQQIYAESYYRDLEEVIDALEAGVPAGPLRDQLLRRFLHSEILRRLYDKQVLGWTPRRRKEFVGVAKPLVQRRFSVAVQESMLLCDQAAVRLLEREDRAGLLELAEWAAAIRLQAEITAVKRRKDGWDLTVAATLVNDDGSPLRVRRSDSGWVLGDPQLAGVPAELDVQDISADFDRAEIDVLMTNRKSRVTWYLPSQWSRSIVPDADGGTAQLTFEGKVRLSSRTEFGDPLTMGTWGIRLRLRIFGLGRVQPVKLSNQVRRFAMTPVRDGRDGTWAYPVAPSADRRLALVVSRATDDERAGWRDRFRRLHRDSGR